MLGKHARHGPRQVLACRVSTVHDIQRGYLKRQACKEEPRRSEHGDFWLISRRNSDTNPSSRPQEPGYTPALSHWHDNCLETSLERWCGCCAPAIILSEFKRVYLPRSGRSSIRIYPARSRTRRSLLCPSIHAQHARHHSSPLQTPLRSDTSAESSYCHAQCLFWLLCPDRHKLDAHNRLPLPKRIQAPGGESGMT
jgi:hypothetical protein